MKNYKEMLDEMLMEGYEIAKSTEDTNRKFDMYIQLSKIIAINLRSSVAYTSLQKINESDSNKDKETQENKNVKDSKKSTGKGKSKNKQKDALKNITSKEEDNQFTPPVENVDINNESDNGNKEDVQEEVQVNVQQQEVTSTETPEVNQVETKEDNDWSQENIDKYADQLKEVETFVQAWGEDYVYNTIVPYFFEDQNKKGPELIKPNNIEAFVAYLNYIVENRE